MFKKDSFAMIAMIGQFYKEQLFDGGNYEVGKMLYCGIRVYNAADKAGRRFEKFLHNFAADLPLVTAAELSQLSATTFLQTIPAPLSATNLKRAGLQSKKLFCSHTPLGNSYHQYIKSQVPATKKLLASLNLLEDF